MKRQVSLKTLDFGKVEEATRGTARQVVDAAGRDLLGQGEGDQPFLKDSGLKGVSSQTQGDVVRVTGKKRDDLQAAIAALKGHDFDLPLQFKNFRD